MELNTPIRLLQRFLVSSRHTDRFRLQVSCFMTQTFVNSYLSTTRNRDERRLTAYGRKVYSQNDEDGIIEEIFKRIGTQSRRFLEIGAGNGLENNSFWLLLQGWSGTWIEGSQMLTTQISQRFAPIIASGRLEVLKQYITRESARDLNAISDLRDIDLLSIDIDGNDYHIMKELTNVNPRLIVVEYNAKFPPPHKFLMPYNSNPTYSWDLTDYFGASLASWNELLQKRGYALVGCNVTGANAFFVRSDLVFGKFAEPLTAENHYEPARYWLSPGFVSGHPANFGEGHRPPNETAEFVGSKGHYE